ncbi:hypothetical protein J3E72DRAFT_198535 [Bipolaris maydis]|nr:hypothetical protein J3E72DRAFT_198535 [Bipolaris maydis]
MHLLANSFFLSFLVGLLYLSLADAFHDHRVIKHRHHRRHLLQDSLAFNTVPRVGGAVDSSGFTFREPVALFARQSAGSGGQAGGSGSTASSGDYTCGPGRPCKNGACCGASGWCGYAPKFCGTGCQSNCDAKAECGQYAKKPGQTCPLNVCCSEHGFCGTTSDFCGNGCQSMCKQPKPNVGSSNSRQVVIGYYEGWNMNKKCGTMTPEEIPVHSLTHLIFSFGFIAPGTFKIEPMSDFQPSLFGRVTDLKMKKPSLKVLIALGGWTHNDPGKYQKVFSDMAASAANRKTFISNLIGFMAEYGFDGVDLDWEYPGAPDRGGIPEDGENLNKLMKEMKDAMGSRYILTFTAPTSYWYLRHFDIKKSAEIADWINLMSYDLHGVWDSDNPIGNQILGHTNLTEIDLALDLLWRNDVSPSKIVLGTGFYGRSFRLEDPKCWTPGCKFSGPGEKGECTATEGFLSYKEVKDILAKTKAKPKLDKDAAVQYLTYGQNSWISYDDPATIQMKVDFANKRGLKGLMTWAIDIDDEKGDLIRALTGGELKEGEDLLEPFAPFNLENLFPEAYLPPADAIPNYDLVSFGGFQGLTQEEDPNKTGIAFFLIAGHSSAVSSMRKRDNPGLEFIDCPHDILKRPNHEIQTARIVCMHQNVTDCFRVEENGVEGTIVHMPDECGGPSWSRAVSLTPSLDQSLPEKVARRSPTSIVYDFKFDYNIGLVRRDAGRLSIRLDYSNVPGYWYAVVDTPGGSQKRDLKTLVDRFFDYGNTEAWYNRFNKLGFLTGNSIKITEKLDRLVYHNGQTCNYIDKPVDEEGKLGESLSVAMQGSSSIELHYGFSMIATWTPGASFNVHQAAGFVRPQGKTDVSFRLGGEGILDTSKSLMGSTITKKFGETGVAGHSLYKGWAFFTAYKEASVDLASGDNVVGAVPFSGYAESRIQSNWGLYNVHFPAGATITPSTGTGEGSRVEDEVSKSTNNKLNALSKSKGWIEVGTTVRVGLMVGMSFSKPYDKVVGDLPDMSVSQRVFSRWNLEHTGTQSCVSTSLGTKMRSHLKKGSTAWSTSTSDKLYVDELAAAGTKQCFKDNGQPIKKRDLEIAQNLTKRDGFEDGRIDWGEIPMPGYNLGDNLFNQMLPALGCDNCASCTLRNPFREPCCGCVCLGCKYGLGPRGRDEGPLGPYGDNSDIESIFGIPLSKRDLTEEGMLNATEGGLQQLEKRVGPVPNTSNKPCNMCGRTETIPYPAFPNFQKNPQSVVDFDLYEPQVMKYFHNSSASCTSWAVRQHASIDMVYDSTMRNGQVVGMRKGFYQTEHPYEAQSISKFFEEHVGDYQNPERRDCAWVRRNIVDNKTPFNGAGGSVLQLMMRELGNKNRPNRLAVFLARSNRMKGTLSSHNSAANLNTFDALQAGDEQLMYVKEFGMIFAYWNIPDIWNSFCDSYNGMRDVLSDFDRSWNSAHATDPSDLAGQWESWNRNNLRIIAQNGRYQAMSLYNRRKQIGGLYGYWWSLKWWTVFSAPLGQSQYEYIKLDRSCRNLQ